MYIVVSEEEFILNNLKGIDCTDEDEAVTAVNDYIYNYCSESTDPDGLAFFAKEVIAFNSLIRDGFDVDTALEGLIEAVEEYVECLKD